MDRIHAPLRAPSTQAAGDPDKPKPLPKIPKQPGPSPDSFGPVIQ